jgi:hypothetical protein
MLLQAPNHAKNLGSMTHRKSAVDRDYPCRVVISGAVAGLADMLMCADWPPGRPLPSTLFEDGKTDWANRTLDQVCLVWIRNIFIDLLDTFLLGIFRGRCFHNWCTRFSCVSKIRSFVTFYLTPLVRSSTWIAQTHAFTDLANRRIRAKLNLLKYPLMTHPELLSMFLLGNHLAND